MAIPGKTGAGPGIILDKLREKQLTEIDKEVLDKKISKAECRQAMRSMADDKSPGPDKLQITCRILQTIRNTNIRQLS
jgi:UDP:flavonoid glycosyltransferase YjiC (YdhE family)